MTAQEYLEQETGNEIKSDKVHLYNIEGGDLIKWLNEFSKHQAEAFRGKVIEELNGLQKISIDSPRGMTIALADALIAIEKI